MVKVLEKHIQSAILDYLKRKGHFCWKNSTVGIFNKKSGGYIPSQSVGAPDIFMLLDARFWGLEVKRPGGATTQSQRDFGRLITQNGGKYEVVYSLDDVIKLGL